MNRKLIHWATLAGENNHCNNNCSLVMTPQRIAIVFLVALHVCIYHLGSHFSKGQGHLSCTWHDVLLNRESNAL